MALTASGKSLTITSGLVKYNQYYEVEIRTNRTRKVPHIALDDIGLLYSNIGVTPVSGVYDVGALCMSDAINKNSLIKPYYTTSPSATASDMAWDIMHGYTIPHTTSNDPLTVMQWMCSDESYWIFNKPTATSYKSLAHFDGYSHDAPAGTFPIRFASEGTASNNLKKLTLTLAPNYNTDNVHTRNLKDEIIPSSSSRLGDLKIGLAVFYHILGWEDGRWEYFKCFDVGGTVDDFGASFETMDIELNFTLTNSNATLRIIPFMHGWTSAESAMTNTARKYSMRIYHATNYFEKDIVKFAWGIKNYGKEQTSAGYYKVTFYAYIVSGSGSVTLTPSDFKVRITSFGPGSASGDVGSGGQTEYGESVCSLPSNGTLVLNSFTLNNQSPTGSTERQLITTNSFGLPSGQYNVYVSYNGVERGFGTITI